MKRVTLFVFVFVIIAVGFADAAKPVVHLPFAAGESWLLTRAYDDGTHIGIDLYALDFTLSGCGAWNKPILAIAAGTVETQSYDADGYGNHILINHGDGYKTRYAHLNSISVSNGQSVQCGQEIGRCGNSGYALGTACQEHPGVHIHVAMYHNGSAEKMEPMQAYQTTYSTLESRVGQYHLSDNIGPCAYQSKSISPTGTYRAGDYLECTMNFRNDGATIWSSDDQTNRYIEIASCNGSGTVGDSYFNYPCDNGPIEWLSCSVPGSFEGTSVSPSASATFTFRGRIRSDASPGSQDVYFTPVYDGSSVVGGWSVPFTVQVIDPDPEPLLSGTNFVPLTGDYDGDGDFDVCLFTTTTGSAYVALNDGGHNRFNPVAGPNQDGSWTEGWGNGDPEDNYVLTADFNDDGWWDLLQMDCATGNWFVSLNDHNHQFVRTPMDGQGNALPWITGYGDGGHGSSIPFTGNFNGDSKADICMFRHDVGHWYVAYNDGDNDSFTRAQGPYQYWSWITGYQEGSLWTVIPLVGNFGGSNRTDISIFTPSTGHWCVAFNNDNNEFVRATNGEQYNAWITGWGNGTAWSYVPISSNIDADSWNDAVVFQPSTGNWSVAIDNYSASNYFIRAQGGNPWITDYENGNWGDFPDCVPLTGKFDSDNLGDILIYLRASGEWRVARNNGSSQFARMENTENEAYDGAWLKGWGVESGSPKLVSNPAATLPVSLSLSQNYPNPFNPVTNISFTLPKATHVSLEVYNILGQRVALLVDTDLPVGNHTAVWNADRQASGIYLYRLQTEDAVETKKMLLLK